MNDDICVAVTMIRRFPAGNDTWAIEFALQARGQGKRSEILTSDASRLLYPPEMQDLRAYAEEHGVEFPR